mgnify:CR=1 FL=1
MHWVFIILGVLTLSLSISNPVYKLAIIKKIRTNIFIHILIRIFLFISSIILIFIGLYLESI